MLYKKNYLEEFIAFKFLNIYSVLRSIFHWGKKKRKILKFYVEGKLNIFNTLTAEAAHKACE